MKYELIRINYFKIKIPYNYHQLKLIFLFFLIYFLQYIHIRRKTIYYGMNWIVPSVLFLLSNVLGFTMPAECGEKITLRKHKKENLAFNKNQINNLLTIFLLFQHSRFIII